MINIILIIIVSFIPVVFWGYTFSSLKEQKLNKKRFILWIFSGGLSVIPILYMDKIIDFIKFNFLNFFENASKISSIFSSLNFWISLSIFVFILVVFSYLFWPIFKKNKELINSYLKNFLLILIFILIISFSFYFINILADNFQFLNNSIWNNSQVYFWNTVFNTIKLIIFYYILVAFIEEVSKHFNFIWVSILDIKKVEDWVLYAIFVALGFSFVENILYFYYLYSGYWINFELVKSYFFRSVFSLMLHVFASSVIAYYFSKAYLKYKKEWKIFPYLKIFFIWLTIAILLHFIFDFSLTLGFGFIVILYFVIAYLYISSIFYRE